MTFWRSPANDTGSSCTPFTKLSNHRLLRDNFSHVKIAVVFTQFKEDIIGTVSLVARFVDDVFTVAKLRIGRSSAF
jgi:hypothetical protein